MTRIYGWDQSHYDGTITETIMKKAVSEGIAFVTHKLGEGLDSVDPAAGAALSAAKAAGVRVIGGYWFAHGDDDPVAEADRCIAVADRVAPWWREFPGWFWQSDCETEAGHGKPSPEWIKRFADRLKTTTGRTVIVYASHGMYGDKLAGLGHPLWNANYGSNRKGAFASVYPGDNSAGWDSYSGQTPLILQYSSAATIAGLTTCDANAYLGTIDELLDLIGADMPLTNDDATTVWHGKQIADESGKSAAVSPANALEKARNAAEATQSAVAALAAQVADLTTQMAALSAAVAALKAVLPAPASGDVEVSGTLHVTEPGA